MSKKKHSVLGMAALAAAGAGAAVLANKSREEKQITEAHVDPNYRNTERGKNEKNSKGIIIQTVITKHLPARRNRKV